MLPWIIKMEKITHGRTYDKYRYCIHLSSSASPYICRIQTSYCSVSENLQTLIYEKYDAKFIIWKPFINNRMTNVIIIQYWRRSIVLYLICKIGKTLLNIIFILSTANAYADIEGSTFPYKTSSWHRPSWHGIVISACDIGYTTLNWFEHFQWNFPQLNTQDMMIIVDDKSILVQVMA